MLAQVGVVQIPRTMRDVTAPWLTSALRASGFMSTGSVDAISVEPFAAGFGLMSQVARLDVVYAADAAGDVPPKLVVKLAAQQGSNGCASLMPTQPTGWPNLVDESQVPDALDPRRPAR